MAAESPEGLTFRRLDHEALPEALSWQLFTAGRIFFHEFFHSIREWSEIVLGFERVEHLVLLDGELLAAHLALVHTTVRWEEDEARVLGVAGVMTLPTFRKRGVMAWMFEQVNRDLDRGDADFGLLFCDPAMNRFYAKQGWTAFPGRSSYGDPDSPQLLDPKEDSGRWRPVAGHKRPKRGRDVYLGRYLW